MYSADKTRDQAASTFSSDYRDDIFEQPSLPYQSDYRADYRIKNALPAWLDQTRLVCFVSGAIGLLITIVNVGPFFSTIENPYLANLTLLAALVGFINYMCFPNLLKYHRVNGLRKPWLKPLHGFMIFFSVVLLIFLLSFPISGLGLALILLPAPAVFAFYSGHYVDHDYPLAALKASFLEIFDRDLHKMAWLSFSLIFLGLIGIFFSLLLGLM
jgi:hypothetical protein